MLGKPLLTHADHDFQEWARMLGWIVPNMFSKALCWMAIVPRNSV